MAHITIQNIIDLGNTALTDVKMIPLTKGKFAIVDEDDYEFLMQWKWFCGVMDCAARNQQKGEYINWAKRKPVYMHRVIMNTPVDMDTDHINGNRLDNRRRNLRICTNSQNLCNQKLQSITKSSKYKGVTWYKKYNKWLSQLRINGKRFHLGYYKEEMEAALAYNEAALKYHGEFARLNDI